MSASQFNGALPQRCQIKEKEGAISGPLKSMQEAVSDFFDVGRLEGLLVDELEQLGPIVLGG